MLLIRRRAGESILIGPEIEIQILEAGPNRVKLGISAPQHISVIRKEAQLTRQENQAAARSLEVNEWTEFLRKFAR